MTRKKLSFIEWHFQMYSISDWKCEFRSRKKKCMEFFWDFFFWPHWIHANLLIMNSWLLSQYDNSNPFKSISKNKIESKSDIDLVTCARVFCIIAHCLKKQQHWMIDVSFFACSSTALRSSIGLWKCFTHARSPVYLCTVGIYMFMFIWYSIYGRASEQASEMLLLFWMFFHLTKFSNACHSFYGLAFFLSNLYCNFCTLHWRLFSVVALILTALFSRSINFPQQCHRNLLPLSCKLEHGSANKVCKMHKAIDRIQSSAFFALEEKNKHTLHVVLTI